MAKEIKREPKYFVFYSRSKARVYHTWGALPKVARKRNTPFGWRRYYSQQQLELELGHYQESSSFTSKPPTKP